MQAKQRFVEAVGRSERREGQAGCNQSNRLALEKRAKLRFDDRAQEIDPRLGRDPGQLGNERKSD